MSQDSPYSHHGYPASEPDVLYPVESPWVAISHGAEGSHVPGPRPHARMQPELCSPEAPTVPACTAFAAAPLGNRRSASASFHTQQGRDSSGWPWSRAPTCPVERARSEQRRAGEGRTRGTPAAQEGRRGSVGTDVEAGTLLQCCHPTGSTVFSFIRLSPWKPCFHDIGPVSHITCTLICWLL